MVLVQSGDVFGTRNPMSLGRAIRAIEAFWAKDNEAVYSHSGIIVDRFGNTIESLWTVKSQNIFRAYDGEKVIIARYMGASDDEIAKALDAIKTDHLGKVYPFWRLFMHMFPPIAKNAPLGMPVCSELVAKFLYLLGARHKQWAGTNPDTLADEWRHWRNYQVIFEGALGKD